MTSHARSALRWLLSLALLATPLAHATQVYCVSDSTGFLLALKTYTQQPGDDIQIKMVRGTYLYGGTYTGSGFLDSAGSPYKLSVLGGYATGTNCAAGSRVINPANTIIDGQNLTNVGISINARSNVVLEGVTFTRMPQGVEAELTSDHVSDLDSLTVRFCAFRNNTLADGGGALYLLDVDNSSISVHDNVFADNAQPTHTGTFDDSALLIAQSNSSVAYVVNNTITNNGANVAGMRLLEAGGSGQIYYVYNNIVWNNYLKDIIVTGTAGNTGVLLSNNIYSVYSGLAPIFTQSNKVGAAFDPLFLNPASGDYHLANASPAINVGAAAVPSYAYPAQDNDGGVRITPGTLVDMGAFESSVDNVTNLVVFTNDDNNNDTTPTVGSMRWAIKQANADAGASTITFSTPCVTLFYLTKALPDITTDVTIDGYHNAAGALANGAMPNSNIGGFNAVICQFLLGQGSLPYAFRTAGSGRLTVTGMGLTGFNDAAIRLETGGGHLIAGNQIGAVPLAAANKNGIRVTYAAITGAATDAVIGGGAVQNYNWIAGSSNVGVYIDNFAGHVTVQGNVIGLDASGTGGVGNGYGVYVGNSPHNTIAANFIGDNVHEGVTVSGISSSSNVITNNYIGADVNLGNQGNGGVGVLLNAGAANNTIGASQSAVSGGNIIAYSGAQGVWVSGSGAGNRILGDSIYGSVALAIDLGTSGPTANDASPDSDTGANHLQNFPLPTSANRNASTLTIVGDLDSSANGTFRLDFYRSASCRSFGGIARGDATNYVGHGSVATDASGHGHFSITLPTAAGTIGVLAATATATNGDTSEIGPCVIETDDIFKDGFGP